VDRREKNPISRTTTVTTNPSASREDVYQRPYIRRGFDSPGNTACKLGHEALSHLLSYLTIDYRSLWSLCLSLSLTSILHCLILSTMRKKGQARRLTTLKKSSAKAKVKTKSNTDAAAQNHSHSTPRRDIAFCLGIEWTAKETGETERLRDILASAGCLLD
jgi:hypothetical protein